MSDAQKQAQTMIEEKESGWCKQHRFFSRDAALLVLDYLVIEGLEVLVSYSQGFWFLMIQP